MCPSLSGLWVGAQLEGLWTHNASVVILLLIPVGGVGRVLLAVGAEGVVARGTAGTLERPTSTSKVTHIAHLQ